MFEVEVQDEFQAAHFLKLYDGSFEPRHGHDWKVSVLLRSEGLDSIGVVVDFEKVKASLKKVLGEFSHISINDHPLFKDGLLNSSTENVAKVICEKLQKDIKDLHARISRVTVWETPDASASYYP